MRRARASRWTIASAVCAIGCAGCGATPAVEPVSVRTTSGAEPDDADERTLPMPLALVRRGLELVSRARHGDTTDLLAVAEELASTLPRAFGDRTTLLYREVGQLVGDPSADARSLATIESILRSFDAERLEMPSWVPELEPCSENGGDRQACQELWPGRWVPEHDFCRSDLECGESFTCVATDGRGARCQRTPLRDLGPG